MSPKKLTRLALVVGGFSLLGMIVMMVIRPGWGLLNWWPAIGLGVAVLLLFVSFLRGAYLTAQKRVEMVDMLNDCYSGVPATRALGSDDTSGEETQFTSSPHR